jgi:hypothetical protein
VVTTVFDVWTHVDKPRELSTTLVTVLLATLAMAGVWIVLWALASRVAFGESRWLRHATIVFVVYATLSLLALALEIAAGALGLPLASSVVWVLLIGLGAGVALTGHLVNASPMATRLAVVIAFVIPTLVVTTVLWLQARADERSPSHIADTDVMLPPALVLRRGLPLDGFLAELAELRARADARRTFVEREDPSPGEDEPD